MRFRWPLAVQKDGLSTRRLCGSWKNSAILCQPSSISSFLPRSPGTYRDKRSLHFVVKKTAVADEEAGTQVMSDEIRLHIETIARHLRGLGLTEQQIDLHVAPLKTRHHPSHGERGVPILLNPALFRTRAKALRWPDPCSFVCTNSAAHCWPTIASSGATSRYAMVVGSRCENGKAETCGESQQRGRF